MTRRIFHLVLVWTTVVCCARGENRDLSSEGALYSTVEHIA